MLEELAQTDLDESPRVEMFRWLLHHFEANTMAGWDLHTDLMRIAISLVRTEDEKKRIQTNLEQIKPNGKDRDYAYQTAQKLKLQLIHQTEDEAADCGAEVLLILLNTSFFIILSSSFDL